MNRSLRLTVFVALAGLMAASIRSQDFATRFANPPAEARILKIIHSWPDQAEAQDQLIKKLLGQGFGGVVCNVSFDQYLESEPKWQAFVRAVNEAKRAGMALWLYDERGYPSGNAGGLTLRDHPEWEACGLLVADAESQGGPVLLELPPGKPFLVAAFPVSDAGLTVARKIDLAAQVRDGKLQWQAPPGRWHVLAVTESRLYEGTHADGNLWSKMPYVNLLQPEPTARFLEVTHDAYARRLGGDLGRHFMGAFTDEPSLMSFFLKAMPYRPLPWSTNLPVEFKKRRGYPLDAEVIPALLTEAGPNTAKRRHDFWLTVGELVSENFFGQIQTCCRAHRFPSGGHLLLEESIAGHVPLYGDFFRCIRRLDAPSIDCLSSLPPEVPWYSARLLASAAELEGRCLVMSETSDHAQRYRQAGDKRPKRTVTEAEIRGTCNRLFVAGVNNITSYYSFADLSDEQLQRLNEWVGRCCTALRGGHQVADLALLYPVESLWTRFTPSRHWTRDSAAANRVQNFYMAAAQSLFAMPRDFTIVDARALAEAKAEPGALVHGPLRWRVVVLPGVDTLPLATWENLARFVRQGGAVIALGELPANSETEFPSAQVRSLAKELFGVGSGGGSGVAPAREPFCHTNSAGGVGIFLPTGSEGLLPLVLNGVLEPDVRLAGSRPPLRVTHRRLEDRDVYFVINDSAKAWSGDVTFSAEGEGELWDPSANRRSGSVKASAAKLDLEPYGAAILRFASAHPPVRRALSAGPLPNLTLRRVPEITPTEGHGEFVRAELARDASRSQQGAPAWRASATLTKSQVDTFLFTLFRPAQPLDLTDADCLVVETHVPAGQRTPNEILVILHEEGGGDYIAHTGRSLGAPGRERSFVPLSRFELAGWSSSKDADGRLDVKRVADIRVGWGGYLGKEGEKVEFTVALPQIGSMTKAWR
ncbi:MAG: hypothetical protein HZA90_00955 [Verrucomicrobia bacterium]|nr:hypothetical protein [Verrucomicrobiota bacterium]